MEMKLSAHGVSYAYRPGVPVLQGISLELGAGKVYFLLGPNGSGKTTLLECLCGLRAPQGGRISLGGRDLYALPPMERARAIAYVPQIHRPVFGYRVLEVVLMGRAPHLGLLSTPGRRDLDIAFAALDAVGLSKLADHVYTELSGGEMRLVLIARGLAQEARFLLLDEPDAHLDPKHQHGILRLVRGLAAEGLSPVLTTHNPNNALLYADSVAILRGGLLVAQGPRDEVLTPRNISIAYGMEFELIGGNQGLKAFVPVQGRSSRSDFGVN